MKSYFTLSAVLLFNSLLLSQILNNGFEEWNSEGNPVYWKATNAPPSYTTITQTSDAHSGNWAVEGNVVTFSVFTIGPTIISGEEGNGIPINFRPEAIHGYYKFTSIQDDYLQVQANFKKNGVYIGGGANNLVPTNSYTEFGINISYIAEDIPDSVLIAIFIVSGAGFPHVGSKMFIDDLFWGGATNVEGEIHSLDFKLDQNFPNPFNPSTNISWQSPISSHQILKVYDVLGNEVATLVDEEKPAGVYEVEFYASELTSGI
jgi:hypothetical protein